MALTTNSINNSIVNNGFAVNSSTTGILNLPQGTPGDGTHGIIYFGSIPGLKITTQDSIIMGTALSASAQNEVIIGLNAAEGCAGQNDVIIGHSAAQDYTGSGQNNILIGQQVLLNQTTPTNEIILGYRSGYGYTTTESNNIIIGYFVSGTVGAGISGQNSEIWIGQFNDTVVYDTYIDGVYPGSASTLQVYVDPTGLIGTGSSSIKTKTNVQDMGASSSVLSKMRPVTFSYKKDKNNTKEYGLIAEEVAQVAPELVVYDKNNEPKNIRYQHLAPMLLNELQKALKRIEVLESKVK